jgi:hypothetical protein
MIRTRTRKRPCKICRRWFMPHPRQGERQKTCGRPECQGELHRRRCQAWNRKNTEYFKTNYLAEKLSRNKEPPDPPPIKKTPVVPKSRIRMGLPRNILIERVGVDPVIILEYLIEQLIRRLSRKQALRPP